VIFGHHEWALLSVAAQALLLLSPMCRCGAASELIKVGLYTGILRLRVLMNAILF
jgi:hypothetical protein